MNLNDKNLFDDNDDILNEDFLDENFLDELDKLWKIAANVLNFQWKFINNNN